MATKFDMSPEAKKILSMLEGTQPDDLLTYNVLRNLTGINDIDVLRGRFYTAANRAFRQWRMRFRSERGVGYIRMDESGKNDAVGVSICRTRRGIKRTVRHHNAVDFTALDEQGKHANMVHATVLAEIRRATSRAHEKKIAKAVEEDKNVRGLVDGSLKLFRERKA